MNKYYSLSLSIIVFLLPQLHSWVAALHGKVAQLIKAYF
jgi:hypothetical protein